MTERVLSQVGFLRVHVVTHRDKVRSYEIWKALNVVPLILRVERSQLRWFGHVSRMAQDKLPRQVLLASATRKRTRGRPWTRWSDYISDLAWYRLGVEPAELFEIAVDREVFLVDIDNFFPHEPPQRKIGYNN